MKETDKQKRQWEIQQILNFLLLYKWLFLKWFLTLCLWLCQDLVSALKGALSGSLEALILGLMKSTAQYDASELKASMKVSVTLKTKWTWLTGYLNVPEKTHSDSWELLLDVSHSLGFFHAGTGDRRGDLNRDRLLQEQWRTSWDQEGLQRQWVTFQEPENTK